MISRLTKFFMEWLNVSSSKTYKIVHDPKLGYVAACYWPAAHTWLAIDGNGEESQSIDAISDLMWFRLWVETKEEAGNRINLHATNRGRQIVWEA